MNLRRSLPVLATGLIIGILVTGCVGPAIDPQGEPRIVGDAWTETTSGGAPAGASCTIDEGGDTVLPDPDCTPGAVTDAISPADTSPACLTSNALEPELDETVARNVLAAYGIDDAASDDYVIDYLVPRSLGGANDYANLWPIPLNTTASAQKDQMDVAVADAVCNGRAGIQAAQFVMASEWPVALKNLNIGN